MACCVLLAYVLSQLVRVFRHDAESRADPEVLHSVTAARDR
jgi:hypothetical protein